MKLELDRGASVGIVVRDLDRVVDVYSGSLGLGPFETEEISLTGADHAGERSPARLRVATAPLGPCEMELIEVTGGRPPHAEFLDEHGEGMNHFNIDKRTHEGYLDTLGRLYGEGIEPFWGYPFNSFSYVESERFAGVTFEVMVGSGHAGKKGHNHLGLVVSDTDRTIDFYSKKLGLGPFRMGEYPMPRAFYRTERIEARFKASFCDLGESRMCVYEVVEGSTPLSDHLATHGEGMHHLCLPVEDLDAAISELASDGIQPLWRSDEIRTAYLDTSHVGGMTFALTEAFGSQGSARAS